MLIFTKQHGGTVVLMEKDADVKLVDHTKKNLSSDVYSSPVLAQIDRLAQYTNQVIGSRINMWSARSKMDVLKT
jgi:hypothetical protein